MEGFFTGSVDFSEFLRLITFLADEIYVKFNTVFKVFFAKISLLMEYINTLDAQGIWNIKIPPFIISFVEENFDYTLIELMFGFGVFFMLLVTVYKYFKDVVTS